MPRKLGQHFLADESILERLAAAACGEHAARVVEIGAGKGALTRHLLRRTDELHAIELDGSLVGHLTRKFAAEPRLHIHKGDVLKTDFEQWGPAAVAGNLPYYITSPIVEHFLALPAGFDLAVFLMQWEVAERILANPGTRDYGYLTVATRLVCDVDLVCRVAPSAFVPPPNVDSAAVRFRRKISPVASAPGLLPFVSRCFAHKRKTLRNNLRPFYGTAIEGLPEASLRAEQLAIEQFVALHAQLTAPSPARLL